MSTWPEKILPRVGRPVGLQSMKHSTRYIQAWNPNTWQPTSTKELHSAGVRSSMAAACTRAHTAASIWRVTECLTSAPHRINLARCGALHVMNNSTTVLLPAAVVFFGYEGPRPQPRYTLETVARTNPRARTFRVDHLTASPEITSDCEREGTLASTREIAQCFVLQSAVGQAQ